MHPEVSEKEGKQSKQEVNIVEIAAETTEPGFRKHETWPQHEIWCGMLEKAMPNLRLEIVTKCNFNMKHSIENLTKSAKIEF